MLVEQEGLGPKVGLSGRGWGELDNGYKLSGRRSTFLYNSGSQPLAGLITTEIARLYSQRFPFTGSEEGLNSLYF